MKLKVIDQYLFLNYIPEDDDRLIEALETREEEDRGIKLKNTFYVDYALYQKSQEIVNILKPAHYLRGLYFLLGELQGDFYKIDSDILQISFNLFYNKNIVPSIYHFVKIISTNNGFSVFSGFNDIYNGKNLYIIHEKEDVDVIDERLSVKQLEDCIKLIPTIAEIKKYRLSRYSKALINYLDVKDKETELDKFIEKKLGSKFKGKRLNNELVVEFDKEKYSGCLDTLKFMLAHHSDYSENDWQVGVLRIFKLINPKYVYIGEKLKLKSFITGTNLYPDIVLIDCDGNIDLIEIKRPDYDLFYKTEYRDNYVPLRELQGTCMQLQNYLISLEKSSKETLNNEDFKKSAKIPIDFKLKSNSPKGYIIYGNDSQLKDDKIKADFQIVRNMYANIIDIITYNDLIQRLETLISAIC